MSNSHSEIRQQSTLICANTLLCSLCAPRAMVILFCSKTGLVECESQVDLTSLSSPNRHLCVQLPGSLPYPLAEGIIFVPRAKLDPINYQAPLLLLMRFGCMKIGLHDPDITPDAPSTAESIPSICWMRWIPFLASLPVSLPRSRRADELQHALQLHAILAS